MSTITLNPFRILSGQGKCAAILVNDGKTEIPRIQEEIWNDSPLRICTIRAAAVMRRLCSDSKMHFPTEIVGDIHSLAVDAKELFHGWSKLHHIVDKDKTSLTLCLEELALLPEIEQKKVDCIVVLGGLTSGRFDCLFGTLNSVLLANSLVDLPIFVFDGRHLATVLFEGKYEFYIDLNKTTKFCGLVPLNPCHVSTQGLQYNIDGKELKFGGLISTSNQIVSDKVSIQTNGPLVFSMELEHLFKHQHEKK